MRRKKRITPCPSISPRLLLAALEWSLAAGLEAAVRQTARFLPIFEANPSRFFGKLE
jgi:hypothetical protein